MIWCLDIHETVNTTSVETTKQQQNLSIEGKKSKFLFFLQTDSLTTHKTHVIIPNDTIGIKNLKENPFLISAIFIDFHVDENEMETD